MARSHSGSSVPDSSMGENRSEICRNCKVEVPVDPGYVMLWLKHAEADATEAKRSKSKIHALYWVQQAVEKLVKARLLAYGGCYCDMMDVGHESLKGFLQIIYDLLQDLPIRNLIDEVTESDSQEALGAVQRLVHDEAMRSDMSLVGPQELRMLLDTVTRLEREGADLLSKLPSFGATEQQSPPTLYERLRQALPPMFRRYGQDVEDLTARFYSTLGVCNHQLKAQESLMSAASIGNRHRWAIADVRLYVLASVTFPHVTSSRYPAHPNAPDDLQAAANFKVGNGRKAKRMGGMGIQHYSNRMGVVYYSRRLAGEAEATARAMQDWWRSSASAGLEPLPRCAECENTAQG